MRPVKLVQTILAMAGLGLATKWSAASAAHAATDWPQFRGPKRDGISSETGLLPSWPATGPKVLWRVPVGAAFSAVTAAWQVDLKQRFGSQTPEWGFAMTPIVAGGSVVLEVGGAEASIAAFDGAIGELRWTAHRDKAGYSSPIAVEFNGVEQLVFMTAGTVVGVTPAGKVLWSVPFQPEEWADFDGRGLLA